MFNHLPDVLSIPIALFGWMVNKLRIEEKRPGGYERLKDAEGGRCTIFMMLPYAVGHPVEELKAVTPMAFAWIILDHCRTIAIKPQSDLKIVDQGIPALYLDAPYVGDKLYLRLGIQMWGYYQARHIVVELIRVGTDMLFDVFLFDGDDVDLDAGISLKHCLGLLTKRYFLV